MANWVINNLRARMAAVGTDSTPSQTQDGDRVESVPTGMTLADLKFKPESILKLVALVDSGEISTKIAQDVFADMFATDESPAAIVEKKGLAQVSDTGAIEKFCDDAIAANPGPAADFRAGKVAALNFGCETKFFIQAASGRTSLRAACALSLYFQKSSRRRLL